uniref:Uncharacterized protein n=1 Tax=Meloidogyne javanica TaxID=6303 RepID=A0A915N4S8_MELJA
MQITIRDYQGFRCCYEVKETDNVEILKSMIEFKTGIDRCSYRLAMSACLNWKNKGVILPYFLWEGREVEDVVIKEDVSSDSDYELIQPKGDLKQENEMENKNVLVKPEIQIIVEELKQTFQQMIDEIKIENDKQNSALKEVIEQKDEKIICLENKVKQVI